MHFRPVLFAPLAFTFLMLAPSALATCQPTTSPSTYSFQADGGTFYVTVECGGRICPLAPFIYEETNGMQGLQRRDEIQDDTCHGRIQADTQIF